MSVSDFLIGRMTVDGGSLKQDVKGAIHVALKSVVLQKVTTGAVIIRQYAEQESNDYI